MPLSSPDLSWLRRTAAAPYVVAHRGASGAAPENTLAAAHLALEMGAPAVECDVHLSADGVPVVIHDAAVDRTTNGHGEVSSLTLAQLKSLDAGVWKGPQHAGERVPALDELLHICAGRARVFVELKVGGGSALVDASLDVIRASGAEVAIISFGPDEVRLVARRRPDLPLGFLVARDRLAQHGAQWLVDTARQLGANFVSPQQTAVDAGLVSAAHAAALPVSVWTVDDAERMRHLAALGVDAVTTNVPDVALATLGSSI